jgi:hypothetical protein
MFEDNVNKIVKQTDDQLDILKEYITYRTTFYVERVLYRLKIMESLAENGIGMKMSITDSEPVKFSLLQKSYKQWGCDKASVITAIRMVVKELDHDIEIMK